MQTVLDQWRLQEPKLHAALTAIGEAANSCAEAQRKIIENQKHALSVVSFDLMEWRYLPVS